MKTKRIKLANVANVTGRVDVAAYRIAERLMANLERQGAVGLRERLLPIVEQAIAQNVPKRIPAELLAIVQVFMDNRRLS